MVGPNSAGNVVSRSTADEPVVDLSGIKNVKLGPNGLQINPGSNLNSTVKVCPQLLGCAPGYLVCRLHVLAKT